MTDFKITEPGFFKTRDGRKVRVLCVDAEGHYPCMGYVFPVPGSRPSPHSWGVNGNWNVEGTNNLDLISPWTEPKPRRVAWLAPSGVVKYCQDKPCTPDGAYTRATWLPDEPDDDKKE